MFAQPGFFHHNEAVTQLTDTDTGLDNVMAQARRRVPETVEGIVNYYGLSGRDVARALGLNPQTVYNKLAGRNPFRHEEILALSDLLAVPVDVLLRLEPRDALRWVLDHPDCRPSWNTRNRWLSEAA